MHVDYTDSQKALRRELRSMRRGEGEAFPAVEIGMVADEQGRIEAAHRRRVDQHGVQPVLFRQVIGVMSTQRRADQRHRPVGRFDQAADRAHRRVRHRRKLRADKAVGEAAPSHVLAEQPRLRRGRRRTEAVQVENQLAVHSTQPKCAVDSTTMPKKMRYQAKGVKS